VGRKFLWLFLAMLAVAALWMALAPPRPLLNAVKRVDLGNPVAAGAERVARYGCRRCHRIGGQGGLTAPDLAGVTQRRSAGELRAWLMDPEAMRSGTAMPNFHLSDSEIEAIIAYLRDQDER
jgi:cytochrome c2